MNQIQSLAPPKMNRKTASETGEISAVIILEKFPLGAQRKEVNTEKQQARSKRPLFLALSVTWIAAA